MLEDPARLANDGAKLELDGLKTRVNPPAARCLQSAEQPIAPRMISLTFGHDYCAGGAGFGPVSYCVSQFSMRPFPM